MFPESENIDDPGHPGDLVEVQRQYNEAAFQVALLVAILYTAVGVLRLGFFANFLSHSVISGFTTGAAIIIGMTQLRYFFGVRIPNTSSAIETICELSKVIGNAKWREALMFSCWLAALLVMKSLSKRFRSLRWLRPVGPISVVVVALCIVRIFHLDDGRIKVVAHIPAGLPSSTFSAWGPLFRGETQFGKQLNLAVIVMLVGFMESISIAKALARKGRYKIAVTQEILGLGLANLCGSLFSSYPTTGSFSRSAVAADVGAMTPLFGVLQAIVVGMVLLFLTPVFKYVPYNCIGAIIVSSVFGLVDIEGAKFLFKANKLDFLVWLAACVGTVLAGVEIGLAIAIGLALVLVIYQSAFPHTAVLGRLPGTEVYRSIKQYANAVQPKGVAIMRVDAPIYFANVQWVRDRIEQYLLAARANPELAPIRFLIVDLSPVSFVDATGMHTFLEVVQELKADNVQLVLTNPGPTVKTQLEKVHLLEAVGKEWVFVRTADAVRACTQAMADPGGIV